MSKKQPISIKGKEYKSITEATIDLNKSMEYISWRLNSKSYTDWVYLNKEVILIDTGKPLMKKVSILGKEYESITEAVKKSGINREIMKYRLKNKKYTDYYYV